MWERAPQRSLDFNNKIGQSVLRSVYNFIKEESQRHKEDSLFSYGDVAEDYYKNY
jgi:hypothetical protein